MSHSPEDKVELLPHDHKVQLVVTRPDEGYEEEISLAELIRKVLDGRKLIALCTLVAILLTIVGVGGYNFVMSNDIGTVSTVISFNFEGINEGLNPNGETFNIGEITNKKVLEDTVTQLGLGAKGIDSEKLRRNIVIQGIVPADIINRMTLINQMAAKDVTQLEKMNDITYHPTQYKIDLHIVKDMHLDKQEAEQVMMTLVNNYKSYFMNKYNDKQVLSTAITTVDFNRYDYSEYIMLVDSQLDIAKTYLEEKEQEAPNFRSKTTGVSFTDLIAQVELIQNVEINNAQAIVNTFTVTKNKERLVSIYKNKINMMTLEMNQHTERATSLRQAAANYKKDAMVVLGDNGVDSAIEFTQSSQAYDKLIQDAVDAEETANALQYEIALYKDLLSKINEVSAEGVGVNIKPYMEQVEKDITYIAEGVKTLVENINTTVDEYYTVEVFKNSVKMDIPAVYTSNTMDGIKKSGMAIAISAVLGLMIGVFLVFFKGILQDEDARRRA